MGLSSSLINLILILLGLIVAGWGLSRKSFFGVLAAPLGWVVFMISLVRFLLPGFFGS